MPRQHLGQILRGPPISNDNIVTPLKRRVHPGETSGIGEESPFHQHDTEATEWSSTEKGTSDS